MRGQAVSEADHAWLSNAPAEFHGHWVALRDGVLLGSDKSRRNLRHRLIWTEPTLRDVLFSLVGASRYWRS
jgi:hypothetical protein